MSSHNRADLPAQKVLTRAIYVPMALSLVLAVYFAVTGDWLLAGIMVAVSAGSLAVYPWYKRQLAARDARSSSS